MSNRSYSEIKTAVERQGFKWFSKPISLNCVWERTSYLATNKFTDFWHVAYIDDHGKEIVITIPATTKPGLKGSLLDPLTVRGITGTAVIVSPQQVLGGWEFKDTFKEFSRYPYFRQIKPADYWRDGDKDSEIDKVQPENGVNNHTHWHIMSKIGSRGSGLVNNWSLGCQGWPEQDFKPVLPIIRESVKRYGTKFTGTFLDSEHFTQ